MIKNDFKNFILFVSIFLGGVVQSEEVSCPESIDTVQEVKGLNDSWSAYQDRQKIELAEAQIFLGHPNMLNSIFADEEKEIPNNMLFAKWRLLPEQEYWIQCAYTATNQTIIKKLPPTIKACLQYYSESQRLVKSMACN